jgi:hypothetical protein
MTKNELYAEMYEAYKSGLSLAEVGKMFGMTRQSVYDGFSRRGYVLRERNWQPIQILDGIKFTVRKQGYYGATTGDRKLMHRYVWEKQHGPIPEGYEVHHVDHDRSNNEISNLEIYTKSDHARLFSTGSNQHTKKPYKERVQ